MMDNPRRIHNMDQMFAAIADLAAILHRYYKELIEQGFTPKEALGLTVEYQRSFLEAGYRGNSSGGDRDTT